MYKLAVLFVLFAVAVAQLRSCKNQGGDEGFCLENAGKTCVSPFGRIQRRLCPGKTTCCIPEEFTRAEECQEKCYECIPTVGQGSTESDRNQCEKYVVPLVRHYCTKYVADTLSVPVSYSYSACQDRVQFGRPNTFEEAKCATLCAKAKGRGAEIDFSGAPGCGQCLAAVCKENCIGENGVQKDLTECRKTKSHGLLDSMSCQPRCQRLCNLGLEPDQVSSAPAKEDNSANSYNSETRREAPAARDRWGCPALGESFGRGAVIYNSSPYASKSTDPDCLIAGDFLSSRGHRCCETTTNSERHDCFAAVSRLRSASDPIAECKRMCRGDNGWFCRRR